jgi:hypothetical protein
MRVGPALFFIAVVSCDGSSPALRGDASTTDGSPPDVGSDVGPEAGTGSAPLRTRTLGSLFPTSKENLLLDSFLSAGDSWGHFRTIKAPTGSERIQRCGTQLLELMSQAPAGVAGPVLVADASPGTDSEGCTQILAPFSGASSQRVKAQIWVSLSSQNGDPLPFPSGTVAIGKHLEVAILPNALPTDPLAAALLFEGSTPKVIAGREWVLMSLKAPGSLTMGGWFSITLVDTSEVFLFTAPEVVPTTLVALTEPPRRPMTGADRALMLEYGRREVSPPPSFQKR